MSKLPNYQMSQLPTLNSVGVSYSTLHHTVYIITYLVYINSNNRLN